MVSGLPMLAGAMRLSFFLRMPGEIGLSPLCIFGRIPVMKHNHIPCTFAALVPIVTMAASAVAAEGWMTDFPAAMQKAEAEGKLVLVDFTGSDWCSACILLRRNVLDNADFRAYAADKFVLMEVDLPQRRSLAPELRQQNEALAKRYGVAAFPTILVLNPQGEVLGGFQEGDKSVKEAILKLEDAYMVNALYRKAAMQSGVERARTLYDAYMRFPETKGFAAARDALRDDIAKNDPGNVTGIHDAAAVVAQAKRFLAERSRMRINSPELGRLLELQLREALPANRSAVMLERCQYAMGTAETVEDIEATRRMFEEVLPLLPENEAAEVQHYLRTYFQDSEALLRMLKASRPR